MRGTHRLSSSFTKIVQREKIRYKMHSTNNNQTRINKQKYKYRKLFH
nr:MAG TPA: hypothetical protein [Caudoviricetes sp.]